MVKVFSYDEMEQSGLPIDILEEMRHFSYARYDTFEGFDCCSLEILDYENLLLGKGSILLSISREKIFINLLMMNLIQVQSFLMSAGRL